MYESKEDSETTPAIGFINGKYYFQDDEGTTKFIGEDKKIYILNVRMKTITDGDGITINKPSRITFCSTKKKNGYVREFKLLVEEI